MSAPPTSSEPFHPGLTKKLLAARARGDAPKRITNEAALLTGELLRIFVKEARHRAAIEAECEKEGTTAVLPCPSQSRKITIRPDHISKVAAEMMMDFS